MSPETIEHLARDLAARIPLPADDWQAIIAEARLTLAVIAALDELPLEGVDPDPVSDVSESCGA
jgi:hypothetical protein